MSNTKPASLSDKEELAELREAVYIVTRSSMRDDPHVWFEALDNGLLQAFEKVMPGWLAKVRAGAAAEALEKTIDAIESTLVAEEAHPGLLAARDSAIRVFQSYRGFTPMEGQN